MRERGVIIGEYSVSSVEDEQALLLEVLLDIRDLLKKDRAGVGLTINNGPLHPLKYLRGSLESPKKRTCKDQPK